MTAFTDSTTITASEATTPALTVTNQETSVGLALKVVSGASTVALFKKDGLTVTGNSSFLSGSNGVSGLLQIGRTGAESSFAVAHTGAQFANGAAAGDLVIRSDSGKVHLTSGAAQAITIGNATGTPLLGLLGASPVGRQTITGSKGSNAALASVITALVNLGLATDSTT